MKRLSNYRTTLSFLTIALLVTLSATLNIPNGRTAANERSTSGSEDPKQFEGCWSVGGYTLYIAVSGDDLIGKIRCNCNDPQKIYDVTVKGKTIEGRWESDTEFGEPGKGKKRRGLFMMTNNGGTLNGTATESDESEVTEFRGKKWPWDWTRQKDTKMCDNSN